MGFGGIELWPARSTRYYLVAKKETWSQGDDVVPADGVRDQPSPRLQVVVCTDYMYVCMYGLCMYVHVPM